jgi:excisionase family DNA binding protein
MITNMTQPSKSTLPTVNWLTVDEVAQYFRMGRMSVYRLIKNGDLPAIRIGGRSYRIDERHVKALMARTASNDS